MVTGNLGHSLAESSVMLVGQQRVGTSTATCLPSWTALTPPAPRSRSCRSRHRCITRSIGIGFSSVRLDLDGGERSRSRVVLRTRPPAHLPRRVRRERRRGWPAVWRPARPAALSAHCAAPCLEANLACCRLLAQPAPARRHTATAGPANPSGHRAVSIFALATPLAEAYSVPPDTRRAP